MGKMKAAIFDMDGLLFDTEQVYQKNWQIIAGEMGIWLDPRFPYEICGTSGERMDRILERYYHVENGHPIAERCMAMVRQDLNKDVPEKKGLREILTFFKDLDYKIAIASSSEIEQIEHNLNHAGIRSCFDALVSGRSSGIKHGKPAPDIFLAAADRVGVEPQACFVFEDAFNGIRAAHKAGVLPVMIPDLIEPDPEIRRLCAYIYPDLIAARDGLKAVL